MKFQYILAAWGLFSTAQAKVLDRQPLSYATIPKGTYEPATKDSETTLLDLIKSRDDLSDLAKLVDETPGFTQAFASPTNWKYTFFAPSNTAFNNTGEYYATFAPTPKGMWWSGQMLQHHYVPNSILYSGNFTEDRTRIQMGSYLWASTQIKDNDLVLNNVATVTEADIPVTNGVVHIVDRVIAGDHMIYEADIERTKQGFIAGSCSNPDVPYC